jgi:hypothetical protein
LDADLERDDVDIVIARIFDINMRLGDIALDVRAIRRFLEEDDGEEGQGDEEAGNG